MALPSGNWATKLLCETDMFNALEWARSAYEDYEDGIGATGAAIGLIGDANTRTACTKILSQATNCYQAIKRMINYWPGNNPAYNVSFYWTRYAGGTDYELTAGKIMAAWIAGDRNERLMTVLTLDELRREAWAEPFTYFKIAPPGGG